MYDHVCGDLSEWSLEAEGQEAELSGHAQAMQKVRDRAIGVAGCTRFVAQLARRMALEVACLFVGKCGEEMTFPADQ